jgi:CDP-6-deoxy-D-xylo-4-hexulose-3-dehydrase
VSGPDRRQLERTLIEEVLERVRRIAELRNEPQPFVPGVTPVKYAGRVYDEKDMEALARSAMEFWLTGGRWHRKLEDGLARWYGVHSARLVNSGSSANLVAVAALMSDTWRERRLKRGDEVITVAAGFPTTVAPVLQLGAVPVFVDVALPTGNIDVGLLERARSPRTRAVMIAHTLGNPFDLDRVVAFCREHDLWLIEDNCDAAGSLYRDRKTGTFGDVATLSFYPPHHMTTGEGGAVLCSSEAMTRVVESIRDWGRDCWCQPGADNTCGKRFEWQLGDLPAGYDHKYIYSHLGFNLKMTDMQASVGVAQLEKLEGFCAARRANWQFYRNALADLDDVLILPEPTPHADPSWFGFFVVVREGAPFTRDAIVRHLESRKIQTRMLFAGNMTRQPAMTSLLAHAGEEGLPVPYRVAGELPVTEAIMQRGFWFGVYPGLTAEMRDYVAAEIRRFVR